MGNQLESGIKAAEKGDVKGVRAALDSGVPVDAKGTSGSTMLYQAVSNYKHNVTRLLLDRGAKGNIVCGSGFTPLYWGAVNLPTDLFRSLVSSAGPGAANIVTNTGETPLHNLAKYPNKTSADRLAILLEAPGSWSPERWPFFSYVMVVVSGWRNPLSVGPSLSLLSRGCGTI